MIEMRVVGIRVEVANQQPILLLAETAGPRSLPIVIGQVEANAIAMHLEGIRPPRPMTHDLLGQVVTALGRRIEQVRVVDFREGTYFGELAFDDGTTVSARPSDAIALAVRGLIPVFVDDAVLEEAGVVIPAEEDGDAESAASEEEPEGAEEEVERFREFLDSISPDDFGPERPSG